MRSPRRATADVRFVVCQLRDRVEALLSARGLFDDEGEVAQDESDDDGQRVLLAASDRVYVHLRVAARVVKRWRRAEADRLPGLARLLR